VISLAEISSNKNIKRPVIVAFLNSSGVRSVDGRAQAPWAPNEVNNQTAFFNESKEKKIGGGPVQRRNAP